MEFTTKVEITPHPLKIGYSSGTVLIGSCFADNIGEKLESYKFKVAHNPFGVMYNPVSVKNNLDILIEEKYFTKDDLYWFNDRWISFSHYSAFSGTNADQSLERINTSIKDSAEILKSAGFLFITLGTSWVYEFTETGKIVANCHKIPSEKFRRFLLKTNQVVDLFSEMIQKLKEVNPSLHIVFTISPIRHWKDGAVKNQVSKSVLVLAVHELVEKFENVSYFPAYEIFMDELRDYRFYAEDMLHPSRFAIEYIWSAFVQAYIGADDLPLMKEIEKIIQATKHRPFNPNSLEHKSFLKNNLQKIEQLQLKYPFLDFHHEKNYFCTA
jgi:hypothetical protein